MTSYGRVSAELGCIKITALSRIHKNVSYVSRCLHARAIQEKVISFLRSCRIRSDIVFSELVCVENIIGSLQNMNLSKSGVLKTKLKLSFENKHQKNIRMIIGFAQLDINDLRLRLFVP